MCALLGFIHANPLRSFGEDGMVIQNERVGVGNLSSPMDHRWKRNAEPIFFGRGRGRGRGRGGWGYGGRGRGRGRGWGK